MVKKTIAIGVAAVALSLGIAAPAAAQSNITTQTAVAQTPGWFCQWLGWC